jgi:GDP-4-dehydro-6-deoxy-D-mannose reductase
METKRALITGVTGFVGSHLAELLIREGIDIYGTYRWRSKLDNIVNIKDNIHLLDCDIRDSTSVMKAVEESRPDYIFHLAAQSFVPMSWKAPSDTMTTNVIGTIHLLESVRQLKSIGIDPVIHIAGSSEEYGFVSPDETPIKEINSLRPLSPYGISKVATDMLGVQYHRSYGLKTVVTRAFNHTGPRRGDVFVTSNFAKQIAEIERGICPNILHVGNLEAMRDFTDVRDIVRAYWLSVNKCKYGDVYNICSGKGIKIKDMLNTLLSMSTSDIKVKQDYTRMRPSDVEILMGDCAKFTECTEWKQEISFEKTMKDLLEYWREKVI